jgi:hypothetical protein
VCWVISPALSAPSATTGRMPPGCRMVAPRRGVRAPADAQTLVNWSCQASESGDSSLSAHKPMLASTRRSTARSSGGTTRPMPATLTQRRTKLPGGTASRPGHRTHQPVLELPGGTWTDSPGRRDE